jgi:UDP-3-O-[3-hydroxymyristoyl] glucosamine N-acyltransferase
MFPVSITAERLAELVQGKLHGDGTVTIRAARPLHQAQAGDITFLDNPRNLAKLSASEASAAVVPAGVSLPGVTLIQVVDPLTAFIAIAQRLHARPAEPATGIDPRAIVHATATVGADVSVEALASIGQNTILGARCRIHTGVVIGRDCKLGDDVVLHPHVVLYDGTVLGDRVIIHANSVIGADGFGYRLQGGKHAKVPQLGTVEIAADVEIGANSAVDRATFGATRIGAGTKIDNLVQVGHNVELGAHNILCAGVAVGGSSSTGQYVVMGGQVGIKDHVRVGAGAMLAGQAGVIGDVEPRQSVIGFPAREAHEQMRVYALMGRLPEIYKDLQRLKKLLERRDGPLAA